MNKQLVNEVGRIKEKIKAEQMTRAEELSHLGQQIATAKVKMQLAKQAGSTEEYIEQKKAYNNLSDMIEVQKAVEVDQTKEYISAWQRYAKEYNKTVEPLIKKVEKQKEDLRKTYRELASRQNEGLCNKKMFNIITGIDADNAAALMLYKMSNRGELDFMCDEKKDEYYLASVMHALSTVDETDKEVLSQCPMFENVIVNAARKAH